MTQAGRFPVRRRVVTASAPAQTNGHSNGRSVVNVSERSVRKLWSNLYGGLDQRRNIDAECGYPIEPTIEELVRMYQRHEIAGRVVDLYPDACWATSPTVYEDENTDADTEFEMAWDALGSGLRTDGESWLEEEKDSPVWEYLHRLDCVAGIGSYGVLLLGTDDGLPLDQPLEKAEELTYLRVFDELNAQIVKYVDDPSDPRYNQPEFYNLTFPDPVYSTSPSAGPTTKTARVHWSRVIHVADNRTTSETFGMSRLIRPLNALLDHKKIRGSSAEMFWVGAFPGYSFSPHPNQEGATVNTAALKDQVEEWLNSLSRLFASEGGTWSALQQQVADPTGQLRAQLESVAIAVSCPLRILMGSERGQLASSQDERDWRTKARRRRSKFCIPWIVRPFADRLISAGILPKPKKSYKVDWRDPEEDSPAEQVAVGVQRTEALAKYVGGNLEAVIPPVEYLTRFLGFEDAEAEMILKAAEKNADDRMTPDPAEQAPAAPPGAPGQPPQGETGKTPPQAGPKPPEPTKPPSKEPNVPTKNRGRWEPVSAPVLLNESDGANCGTGSGGFKPGNKCAKGSFTTRRGETLVRVSRRKDGVWRTADGKEVPHAARLKIPPGWKDVYVNPDPGGTLMVRGTDAKGRMQSRYGDTHNAAKARDKFRRVSELRRKRESIVKETVRDAKDPDLRDRAECLHVVMRTGIRPGSGSDTGADYKSYGATTLEGRHVVVEGGKTYLRFVPGKHKGKEVNLPVTDSEAAAILKRRASAAGPDGRLFSVTEGALGAYSRSKDGGGFKTKDHRTALGTETAIAAMKGMDRPTTAKQYKAQVKEVATVVSQTLGNTPSVALKSYIDPVVFSGWRVD